MFDGDLYFLSNFYPCNITINGITFPSVENAFQSRKCANYSDMIKFRDITSGQAKRLGRRIEMRDDWDSVKLDVMYDLVKIKFSNPELKSRLLSTGDYELVENNNWKDFYWGRCNGVGQNHLGKILMRVREELR